MALTESKTSLSRISLAFSRVFWHGAALTEFLRLAVKCGEPLQTHSRGIGAPFLPFSCLKPGCSGGGGGVWLLHCPRREGGGSKPAVVAVLVHRYACYKVGGTC